MTDLSPSPKFRATVQGTGIPLVGGQLFTYAAGASPTPPNYQATYKDSAGTANTNPVILDSNGECDLWLSDLVYKYVLKNSIGNTVWTVDNITTASGSVSVAINALFIDTWAAISTVTPSAAGQLFTLKQHTSGGLGGGTLMAFAGSVTDDGGTRKNCLGGFYLKRTDCVEIPPEAFGAIGDGLTDDLVALQKYCDHLLLNNSSANFSARNYYISASLVIAGAFRTFLLRGVGTGNSQTASSGGSCIVTNGNYNAITAYFNTFANENISVQGLGLYNIAQNPLSGGAAIKIIRGASNSRYISGFKFTDTFASGYGAMFSFQGMNTADANLNFFGNIRMEGVNAQGCGIGLLQSNCTLNLLTMIDTLFFSCPYGGIKLERDGDVGGGNGKGSAIVASLFKCHMEGVGGMFRTQTASTIDAALNTIRSSISLYDFTHESSGATIGPVAGDPYQLGTDTDVFVYGTAVRGLSYGENAYPVIKSGCTITSGTPFVCIINAGGTILTPATVNAPTISQTIANGGNYTFTVTHTDARGYLIASRLLFANGQAGYLEVMHDGIDSGVRTNTVKSSRIGVGITVTYPAGAGTSVANINVANATGFGLVVKYTCENYSSSTITQ